MKFTLNTSGYFYEKPLKAYEKLGFSFKKKQSRFIISGEPEIEINSLEELMSFIKDMGQIVIKDNYIEIYDNYRE